LLGCSTRRCECIAAADGRLPVMTMGPTQVATDES